VLLAILSHPEVRGKSEAHQTEHGHEDLLRHSVGKNYRIAVVNQYLYKLGAKSGSALRKATDTVELYDTYNISNTSNTSISVESPILHRDKLMCKFFTKLATCGNEKRG